MAGGELFRIDLTDLFPTVSPELIQRRKDRSLIVYTTLSSVIEHVAPSKMKFGLDPDEAKQGPPSTIPFLKEWDTLDLSHSHGRPDEDPILGNYYDDPEELALSQTIYNLLKKNGDLRKVWSKSTNRKVYVEDFVKDHTTCIKILKDLNAYTGKYTFTSREGSGSDYRFHIAGKLKSWAEGMGQAISFEGINKPIIMPTEETVIRPLDMYYNNYQRYELDVRSDVVSLKGAITKRNKNTAAATKNVLDISQANSEFKVVEDLEKKLEKIHNQIPDLVMGAWLPVMRRLFNKYSYASIVDNLIKAIVKDKSPLARRIRSQENLHKLIAKPYLQMVLARRSIMLSRCKIEAGGCRWKKKRPLKWTNKLSSSKSDYSNLAELIGIPEIFIPDGDTYDHEGDKRSKQLKKLLDETLDLALIRTKDGYVWKYTRNQKAKQKKETVERKVIRAVKSTLQQSASAA